jgi:hypothetical protein
MLFHFIKYYNYGTWKVFRWFFDVFKGLEKMLNREKCSIFWKYVGKIVELELEPEPQKIRSAPIPQHSFLLLYCCFTCMCL